MALRWAVASNLIRSLSSFLPPKATSTRNGDVRHGDRSEEVDRSRPRRPFAAAIDQAKALSNPELTPDHLLGAMMRQDDTIVPAVLAKLGLAPLMVRNQADEAVAEAAQGLRRRRAADEPRAHQRRSRTPSTYRKDLKDDFLSVEHLLLAMNQRLGVGSEELLQALQRGARSPPRHRARTPRRSSPALEKYGQDLTAARRATARSIRSSAATTRSAGSSRCCRGAPRTTRC